MNNDFVITANELKQKFASQEKFILVDVREPEEFEIARIPGSILIPLRELSTRFQELDPHQEIVLQCHHGMRSMQALHFLKSKGYTSLKNLEGGIDAWSDIDSTVPRY